MLKINCKGERTGGKANKGINVEKNNKLRHRFKKLKIKIKRIEKKEENSTELQKSIVEPEVYGNNKKCGWGKKKKLNSLIGFLRANKTNSYNRGGQKRGKKSKRIYRTSKKIRIMNVFLESLLSMSFPSLGVAVHLTSLGCPATLLISAPAVGANQILIWSYSTVLASSVHSYQN